MLDRDTATAHVIRLFRKHVQVVVTSVLARLVIVFRSGARFTSSQSSSSDRIVNVVGRDGFGDERFVVREREVQNVVERDGGKVRSLGEKNSSTSRELAQPRSERKREGGEKLAMSPGA